MAPHDKIIENLLTAKTPAIPPRPTVVDGDAENGAEINTQLAKGFAKTQGT
jgi:hypothetical protein